MTFDEFARVATAYFHEEGERRSIVFRRESRALVLGALPEVVSTVLLDGAWREYQQSQGVQRKRVLARRFWSSVHATAAITPRTMARSMLPKIQEATWLAMYEHHMAVELADDPNAADAAQLPFRPVSEELIKHLTFFLPTYVIDFSVMHLHTWGIEEDELFETATSNLELHSQLPFDSPTRGVYVSPYRDGYDATRMLLTDRIRALKLKGAPVVIAPTHDLLFITGDRDVEGLAEIATWAEDALIDPHPLSSRAFHLGADGWSSWLPPLDHPCSSAYRLLRVQNAISTSARQRNLLEVAGENGVVIAPLLAYRTPRGDYLTVAEWYEGEKALLPAADRLRLFPLGSDAPINVDFQAAYELLAATMVRTSDLPPRYEVLAFPDRALLEEVAALAEREA